MTIKLPNGTVIDVARLPGNDAYQNFMHSILHNRPDFIYPEPPIATHAADQKLLPPDEMFKSLLLLPYGHRVLHDLLIKRKHTLLLASPPGFADFTLEQRFRDDLFSIGWSRNRPVSELFSGEAAIVLYILRDVCLLPSPFKQTAEVKF